MKIHLLSDLHLDVLPFSPPETDADVVVLAGDIAPDPRVIAQWVGESFRGKPVLLVPGNHEYYDSDLTERRIELREMASSVEGLYVLDNDEIVLNGVRFLGATLWSDFELYGEVWHSRALRAARSCMADFWRIRDGTAGYLQPERTVVLHRASRQWLKLKLHQPFHGKTIVVTHHAPHRGSLASSYAKDLLSAGFVSDLKELMGFSAMWLHGHTHTSFDYQVESTRVVCNPRGYCYRDYYPSPPGTVRFHCENRAFDPGLVVEV